MTLETELRGVSVFSGLGDADVAEVARHALLRRLSPGESAFEQGQVADLFYLLTEGRLKVTQVTPEGKQVVMRLVDPGEFCGMAPALARKDYPAACRAIVASRLIAWPTSYWPQLMETHPKVALGVTQTLGRQVNEVHARIAELATEDAARRIAHAILRLAERAGKPTEEGLRIDFPLTRQDIAEMSGTTLHSVSRIVAAWTAQGLVSGGRRRLVVQDMDALARIADGVQG